MHAHMSVRECVRDLLLRRRLPDEASETIPGTGGAGGEITARAQARSAQASATTGSELESSSSSFTRRFDQAPVH